MFSIVDPEKCVVGQSIAERVATPCVVGLIGRSGVDVPDILNALGLMNRPKAGHVACGGPAEDHAPSGWQSDCAMIRSGSDLDPHKDVISTVLYGGDGGQFALAKVFKLHALDRVDRALALLDDLGIGVLALRRVEQLSDGQRQQVAIASAFMDAPKVVFAVEPSAGLDPLNARAVMQNLRRLQEDRGCSVVLDLQSSDIAQRYCDYVVRLDDGCVAADGVSRDLSGTALKILPGGSAPTGADRTQSGRRSEWHCANPEQTGAPAPVS
ncbi:ATP-binding cassette domain-containing protein [Rhodobacteraceae bacterium M382]|nr:ATP-binding cassette domain-containing protein [Rhodobacteraceae bacterium M382]